MIQKIQLYNRLSMQKAFCDNLKVTDERSKITTITLKKFNTFPGAFIFWGPYAIAYCICVRTIIKNNNKGEIILFDSTNVVVEDSEFTHGCMVTFVLSMRRC